MSSNITIINPETFGPAVGPYSQATVAGGFIFCAGQVALDSDNKVVAPGDAREQTIVALERVETILAEAGASLSDVVTATVWLTDLGLFAAFNEGWSQKFAEHKPARAALKSDLLFEGLVVEIQVVAVKPA